MATLIPSISTCKFDTTGERAFANLLEAKLEEYYLCWYNVPIGKAKQKTLQGRNCRVDRA